MIWYRLTFFFSLSVRILVARDFCLPDLICIVHKILRRDTHWHAMFSRWCCRNLGQKQDRQCLHKPPVAVLKTESIRSTKTNSNWRWHVYNCPCPQCYDLNSHRNILTRYAISISEEVWSDVKIKTRKRNFKFRTWELLEPKQTAVDGKGSVKREFSCLRQDCLKWLRCIWNNS